MSSEGFDKSTIINSFLDEVSAYIPEIEAHLDRLQVAPEDPEALEEAYRRAHTIAGSAAMMGFNGLAHIGQGMESILDAALEQRAILDAPTIALLRRACGRLDRASRVIREGGPDTTLVAEDDQDHMAYRGPSAAYSAPAPLAPTPADGVAGGPAASAAPGQQEPEILNWLAAFGPPAGGPKTPAIPGSGELAGPRDPLTSMTGQRAAASGASAPLPPLPPSPVTPEPWSQSLTDMATGLSSAVPTQPPAFAPAPPDVPAEDRADFIQSQATAYLPAQIAETAPPRLDSAPLTSHPVGAPAMSAPLAPANGAGGGALSAEANEALDTMRADEESVRRQAASLRETVEMLREAAQAMEYERGQLQSFLDGSHDALERLEGWVGQQMNLDLRHSPEAVRAYLPLSVIWVTTTRLKKLIALLTSAGRNLTVTQEQIDETLAEFRSSLETLAQYAGFFTSSVESPGGGFTATVAQFNWSPPSSGQSAVDSLSAGQRADMERAVREDLRRLLEDEVRQDIAADIRREEEERIRQELEVRLRRQMMFSTLGPGMGDSAVTVQGGAVEVRPQARGGKRTQVTTEQSPEAQEVFREEAAEHLRAITNGIAALERTPGDEATIQSVRRATHTLKGAAGMMGFTVIQRLAHASEDLLDLLAGQGRALSSDELALLFETAEALDQLISGAIPGAQTQREVAQALIDRYGAITGHPAESLLAETSGDADVSTPDGEEPQAPPQPEGVSVRIRLSRLDELVNLFGELLVNRSIYEERIGRLNRLVEDSTNASERLLDINNQLDRRFSTFMIPSGQAPSGPFGGLPPLQIPNMPSSLPPMAPGVRPGGPAGAQQNLPDHLRGFDALEMDRYDEFHRLSGILGEIVNDEVALAREMANLIRELQISFARETRLSSEVQERLLKARLVPLSTLGPRLFRAARNSARREGKEVEFFLEGGEIEVDRKIVEEVEGPLLHLVRNSVNHGIEMPDVREAAGKPRAGRIVVSAAYEGNQVLIEVSDDGRGIDPNKLRSTAVARGWIDAYANISDREAINLIFQPGVSTAESVTEESGRGVGLDVVRDAATRLKGSVEVESEIGNGAIFSLRFPISLQIARAVLVKVNENTYAIPMAVVDQIGRLDYYERIGAPAPAVVVRGEQYTLVRLATLLHQETSPIEERASLLIVNAGRRRVALLVDGIVEQREIVAKSLGSHLRNVHGVAGATALGNGQLVVILELLELLANPLHDDIQLPAPGSGRRDTLPTAAVPATSPRQSAQSAPRPGYAAPSQSPVAPGPASRPAAAPWGGSSTGESAAFAAQAGRSQSDWSGFPPPAGPSTPLAPYTQGAGPSTPLPAFLRPPAAPSGAGPSAGLPPFAPPGPQTPPFFGEADSTSRLPPLGGQAEVAPLPQRAQGTGASRDFVVEVESRRTASALSSKPAYVLVVDDSPSVRTVVTGMLKANGWETQSARDGIEALEAIGRKRPSAVLLDIEMPRMDGYELMTTLRSDPQYRNLPLIVLTSRGADKHRLRAQQLGANAYVVKPYRDQSLLETISSLVQKAQSGAL